jgi:hypothetical protein
MATKQSEIDALRDLATRLGPESYIGPWIMDALPWIADQIRSDMPLQTAADMSLASERAQGRIIGSAEDKAQSIIRQADAQAAVLLADAKRRAAAEAARVERWRNDAQRALARLSASL